MVNGSILKPFYNRLILWILFSFHGVVQSMDNCAPPDLSQQQSHRTPVEREEGLHQQFEDLWEQVDLTRVGERLVAVAKKHWGSLSSESVRRLSQTQYFERARAFFLCTPQVSPERILPYCEDLDKLEDPYSFERIMTLWVDLVPQLADLVQEVPIGSVDLVKQQVIKEALRLSAQEIIQGVESISHVRKMIKGRDVFPTALKLRLGEAKARAESLKDLMACLVSVNEDRSHKLANRLFKLPEEQIRAFHIHLLMSGVCTDRPLVPTYRRLSEAKQVIKDFSEFSSEQRSALEEIYTKVFEGMDKDQVKVIKEALPHWSITQVTKFVECVIPFTKGVFKETSFIGLEVPIALPASQYFKMIQMALKERCQDITPWCEILKIHSKILLLTDQEAMPGLEQKGDIICTALMLLPNDFDQRCRFLEDHSSELFPLHMDINQRVGIVVAVLCDRDHQSLQARLAFLNDIVPTSCLVGKGIEAAHQETIQKIFWMDYPCLEALGKISENIMPETMGIKERLSLLVRIFDLTPEEILDLPSKLNGKVKSGNIQDY